MPSDALSVFLHTNRDTSWLQPPAASSYSAHAGWATDSISVGPASSSVNLTAQRVAHECCYRAPWSVNACYKYDWMLESWKAAVGHDRRQRRVAGRAKRAASVDTTALLSDTDVLFQCTAAELRVRFESRFGGAPLVVGGERRWYPLPREARDPFGPDPSLPFPAKYKMRRARQFYPNSGLVMGTMTGFEALTAALRRSSPRFPCCAYEGEAGGFQLDPCNSCRPKREFPQPVPCTVEDQACLQVALASQHAPPHAIDTNATLFLHLDSLRAEDVELRADGRLAFKPTGEAPCVLHANGFKGVLDLLEPRLRRQGAVAWGVTRLRGNAHDAPKDWHRKFPALKA